MPKAVRGLKLEKITSLAHQCEDLRLEMQRHSQLLEWLVSRWNFHEMTDLQQEMKQKLGESEELTLNALEHTVKQARNVFSKFGASHDNETFDFLQHFIKAGSVLVNPCLEHFANINASEQSEWSRDGESKLDLENFGDVVRSCYGNLAVLALGGDNEKGNKSQQTVERPFFCLVSQELSKLSESKMEKEVTLLLEYFGSLVTQNSSSGSSGLSTMVGRLFSRQSDSADPLQSRRKILLDAFRVHRIAQSIQPLQRALQVMRQDWLLQSECFAKIQQIADQVLTSSQVNIAADAARLPDFRAQGLADDFHPHLFQTLEQRPGFEM